jgi:hypothetical protein
MNTRTHTFTGFEELENRLLLSGDVSVVFDGGDLKIIGDGAANEIRVLDNNTGGLRVIGLNGTLINGAGKAFNSAAVNDVFVKTKGGNDLVEFRSKSTSGFVKMNTGAGDDKIVVEQEAAVSKNLVLNTSVGNDCIHISDSNIMGRANIYTRSGNDSVIIDAETTINRGLTLKMDVGNDKFRAENSTIKGKVFTDLGDGDDREGLFDMLFTSTHVWNGGNGADLIVVNNSELRGSVTVLAGAGADTVIVQDDLYGRNSRQNLTVDTGTGNDFVLATGNTFRSNGVVDGGANIDNLSESGNTFIGDIGDQNFEGTAAPANVGSLVNSVRNFSC